MPTTYLRSHSGGDWEEMEPDPAGFLLGEDIGHLGGAFKDDCGILPKHFGERRVVDTPMRESAIVGAAMGPA